MAFSQMHICKKGVVIFLGVEMNPVFLIGAERSGTTLLRLMLNGHPEISWLNEFEYSVDRISSPHGWPDLEEYYDFLSTHRVFLGTGFEVDKSLDYPDLIASFLKQKQQRDKKPVVGATCHRHYDSILRLFPQAKFVYLLRDPRDVARSNIGMGWAGNMWIGVERWLEAEKLWADMKKELSQDVYVEIRSEELILSPEENLTAICNFIGVDYHPEMMEYPDNTTYSRPDPKLTEQWKRKLSTRDIKLVEARAYTIMKERGYEPHFDQPEIPGAVQQWMLQIQNKIYRLLYRIKYIGLWRTLEGTIARKLGITSLEKKNLMIINEKTKKYLK